ncbi:MAG: Spy/CpxP family protein refolding chaperone [Proteobacteria bacterium]|nr:Spy/CpxP family protein refolding chaperone [Pseudomonadota bacterium]
MKQLYSLGIVALMLSVLVTSTALAKSRSRGRSHHKMRGDKILAKLDLTPEQKEKVAQLKEEMQRELKSVTTKKRKLGDQMHTLWTTYPVDKERILAMHRKIASLHQEIRERRIEFRIDVLATLTPEQLEKRTELMEARKEHRRDRRRNRRHGRNPSFGDDSPKL